MKLESVERRIKEKTEEAAGTPRERQGVVRDELKTLQAGRNKLRDKWEQLDGKMKEGAILSTQEERRLGGMAYTGYPLHRENRENSQKDSLSGKTQAIWKFCQNTGNLV